MKLLAVVFVISKYVCVIAKHDLSSQQNFNSFFSKPPLTAPEAGYFTGGRFLVKNGNEQAYFILFGSFDA